MDSYPNQPNAQPSYGSQPSGYGQFYQSYMPTGPLLSTPTGIYPLAGFWLRVAAAVLDFIVLFIAGIIIGMTIVNGSNAWMNMFISPLYIIGLVALKSATLGKMACGLRVIRADGTAPKFGTAIGRYFAAFLFQLIAYGILMVSFFFGFAAVVRTVNPRSVAYAGTYFSTAGGLGIFFIGMAAATIVLCLDYAWMLWDPRKQTLHDKMAHTFVIKSR